MGKQEDGSGQNGGGIRPRREGRIDRETSTISHPLEPECPTLGSTCSDPSCPFGQAGALLGLRRKKSPYSQEISSLLLN